MDGQTSASGRGARWRKGSRAAGKLSQRPNEPATHTDTDTTPSFRGRGMKRESSHKDLRTTTLLTLGDLVGGKGQRRSEEGEERNDLEGLHGDKACRRR